MGTRHVAAIGLISALTLATNYAMFPLFQVKLMDSLVFVAGYLFGLRVGVPVAAIAWLVYGTLNPLGAAGFPLILVLMTGEMVYAISGSLLARTWRRHTDFKQEGWLTYRNLALGVVGVVSTLGYDLWTNALGGLLIYGTVSGMILWIFAGVLWGLVHQSANFVLFALVVPILIHAMARKFAMRTVSFVESG